MELRLYREDPRPRPKTVLPTGIDPRVEFSGDPNKGQDYERQFAKMWVETYPDIDLYVQIRISDDRLHRADFCHWPTKTLIEIDGGTWMRGSRQRAHGGSGDAEKSRIAAALGFVTLRFTKDDVKAMWKSGSRSELALVEKTIRRRQQL